MGKTSRIASAFAHDDSKTVMPTEQARGMWIDRAPSAQALKVLNLMIDVAGGRMGEDVTHRFRLSDIKRMDGMRNQSQTSIVSIFSELHAMTYHFDDMQKQVHKITNLMDETNVRYSDEYDGDIAIEWSFTRGFQRMAASSDHWAIIDRQTLFALRSRYSLLLFQHLSSYFDLDHIHYKKFSLEELRAVLNVPKGKHKKFPFFNRDVLKPTLAEINQLSRFEIKMQTIKEGRAVVAIELSWSEKKDLAPTKKELNQPQKGRKARREGKVELSVIDIPFPQNGGLSYDKYWRDEGRRIWSDQGRSLRDFPDTNLIANHVRKKASEQNIPLNHPKMKALFENVIKAWIG